MTFAVKLIPIVWGRMFNAKPGTVSEKHCCLLLFVIELQFTFLAWLSTYSLGFPDDTSGKKKKKKKKFTCQCRAREMGSLPGSGRSLGEENGNPLQYSCLEKSHGLRSLAGYSLWGHKELDTTECLKTHTRNSQSTWTAALRTELQRLSIYACKLANGHLASSLSWYLVKFSKEQQTCTVSLSCFSVSSARIMGFIAKVSKC